MRVQAVELEAEIHGDKHPRLWKPKVLNQKEANAILLFDYSTLKKVNNRKPLKLCYFYTKNSSLLTRKQLPC